MPVWSWIVNLILWTISICLAGFSIRFILRGVRDLRQAKWSEYADKDGEMLNSYKSMEMKYRKMIDSYENMISETEKLFRVEEPIPENLVQRLLNHLENDSKKLTDLQKEQKENLETQINISEQLLEYAKKGGVRGFSALSQIEATKNLALSAVFLAISSAGFSISSVITTIAK